MKFIVALSSIALISLSSVSPCLAANQAIGRSTIPSYRVNLYPSTAQSIQGAGIFALIEKGLDILGNERERAEEQKRAEQERFERKAEAEEEAKKAEAEQERKRVESPSPARQEASNAAPDYYFSFNSNPDLCKGQVVNEGSICLVITPERSNGDKTQEARLLVLSTERLNKVITSISVTELRSGTGKKETGFWIIMTRNSDTGEKPRTIVNVYVDKDGTSFLGGKETRKETVNNIAKYDKEIKLLFSALK